MVAFGTIRQSFMSKVHDVFYSKVSIVKGLYPQTQTQGSELTTHYVHQRQLGNTCLVYDACVSKEIGESSESFDGM